MTDWDGMKAYGDKTDGQVVKLNPNKFHKRGPRRAGETWSRSEQERRGQDRAVHGQQVQAGQDGWRR